MRRLYLPAFVLLAAVGSASANGVLIPQDRSLPPLAMVYHRVNVQIDDQVAVTAVEQAFRNHTDRPLEAVYVFPVPRGASVNKFTMTVDGKEVAGEMVEAAKARQVYHDIVRRTLDPGLLEYLSNDLLRLRVFPVPPRAEQRIGLRFTSVAQLDGGLVEYVYPMKTDGKANATLQDFSVKVTVKSSRPLLSVYSPTHAVTTHKLGEKGVEVTFDRSQAQLDKDFQLFYAVGDQEVGLTGLTYKPITSEDGYFLFLISPQLNTSKTRVLPKDVAFVLDTSGSMAGVKLDQAKKALRHCLGQLNSGDRFAVLNFSTTVGRYRDQLAEASSERVEDARRWVDNLRPTGGTAIDDALREALAFRTSETGRTFNVIFFTDGLPTVGVTSPQKIVERFANQNTANTRVFTFGVGDDVNATMLDQLAEHSRAVSTYVRPAEDIEVKASSLYGKVSAPVMTNLRLTAGANVRLSEVYPPNLPDLFQGGQIVVIGRYSGQGSTPIRLAGHVGGESREFVYETNLAARGGEDRDFVEHLWARRKVGYLIDQIRANGEKKELVDEVTALAKKYGIATPYTSYLIVPDGPVPVAGPQRPTVLHLHSAGGAPAPALQPAAPGAGGRVLTVTDLAREHQKEKDGLARGRGGFEDDKFRRAADSKADAKSEEGRALAAAAMKKLSLEEAKQALVMQRQAAVQAGRLGVDLSVESNKLRAQSQLTPTALKVVGGRRCLEIGGVWIDEGFEPKTPTVAIKAQSAAYFRLLERHPAVKDVYRLGNHVLWVAPSGTALVIDTTDGKEELSDAELDAIFTIKK